MDIIVRQESEQDYKTTEDVVKKAFENAEHSDNKEHELVARLRKSEMFIPELSLVAEHNGEILGHIMLTKLSINNNTNKYASLALAPVSVLPEWQNKGIGSRLITESIKTAKKLGYKSIVVLGHEIYYPKFGFRPASRWGIKPTFDVKDEAFMALELEDYSLFGVSGNVEYSREFFE